MTERDVHWLRRPETIRRLWIVGIAVLAVLVLLQAAVAIHGHFGVDGTFGFNAWFGFASCVAMVVFAKILGIFLKRRDSYYDRD